MSLRYLRLWRRFVAQAFVRDTHYRAHFLTTLGVGVVQLGLSLVPVWLLFGYTNSVRGWSRDEVIALVGLYQIATGLLGAFVAPNVSRMTDYITEGELDGVLIQPVSAQFYLMFRWVDLAELGGVVTGAAVLVLGLLRAGATPAPGGILRAALLLGCGLVLLTCAWSALAFLAFWTQAAGLIGDVFNTVLQAGRSAGVLPGIGTRISYLRAARSVRHDHAGARTRWQHWLAPCTHRIRAQHHRCLRPAGAVASRRAHLRQRKQLKRSPIDASEVQAMNTSLKLSKTLYKMRIPCHVGEGT